MVLASYGLWSEKDPYRYGISAEQFWTFGWYDC